MSRKTILGIEFFSLLTMSTVLGAWLRLLLQWMNGGEPILWAWLTAVLVAVIGFDAYRVLTKLSPGPGQSKIGILVRLIGIIFVASVTGLTLTDGIGNLLRGNGIFWAQLMSSVGLLFLGNLCVPKHAEDVCLEHVPAG